MKKIIFILFISILIFLPYVGASSAYNEALLIHQIAGRNVRYMSGGVGLDERQAMKAKAREFDLKFEFAILSGQYLSGVTVVIFDSTGKKILRAVSGGPWFMADLPRGEYRVAAIYKDQIKDQQVSVDKGLKTILFHWKP